MKMNSEKLCELLQGFANYYWSVPVSYVFDRITQWHPEVSAEQLSRILRGDAIQQYHFYVESDGLEEPEIVVEHLFAFGDDDFKRFIAARYNLPYRDCDEEALLRFDEKRLDIPEKQALVDFAKNEMGIDDRWTKQLVNDCVLYQPYALMDGKSWVMSVLRGESYGKIAFRSIEQVKRFRELGTRFFEAMPNPVLRGWKPCEIENPPVLPDDIPEKDEDIPDSRGVMNDLLTNIKSLQESKARVPESASGAAHGKKIGPNDPCPCGSGKKYKKCCGR